MNRLSGTRRFLAAAAALLMVGASLALAAAQPTASAARMLTVAAERDIVDLGTLGGDESGASDINDAGQVVGYAESEGGESRAVLWEDGEVIDLGTLEDGGSSRAYAINEEGVIVGEAESADGTSMPVVWVDGEIEALAILPDSGINSASDINNEGIIVGSSQPDPSSQHAVLWEDREITDLGTLQGSTSDAKAINDQGQVVGTSQGRGGFFAFLWDDGEMTELEGLGGDSAAEGINSDGVVVGELETEEGDSLPAMWVDGQLETLDTLGGLRTVARAANDDGLVVGYSVGAIGDGPVEAVVWEDGQIAALAALADGASYAFAVNGSGDIVGYSEDKDGNQHAVLWSAGGKPGDDDDDGDSDDDATGSADGDYESPQYGYTLTYDPEVWSVQAEDSDPDDAYDRITLRHGDLGLVQFVGDPDYRESQMPDCVEDYEAGLEESDGISGLRAMRGEDGEDEGLAWAAFTYEFETSSGEVQDLARYIECRYLGDVTVVIHQTSFEEDFDDMSEARAELIEGLEAP